MIDTSNFVAQYQAAESFPQIWPILAQTVPQEIALWDPHAQPEVRISYGELWTQIQQFAAGLQRLGVEPAADDIPPRIALFADDSPRWMIADQGIMTAGAADAVRGATADPEELAYILQNSGSTGLVLENLALLDKLHGAIQDLPIRFVVLLSDEDPEPKHPLALPVFNFGQLMAQGEDLTLTKPATTTPDDLATLIYTSGTTGKPKGVMLTHRNLLHQLTALYDVLKATPGEIVLSILPTWHSFGRVGEYYCLSQGTTIVYTNIRHFKGDLRKFKPHYMVSVPRIWESIHEAAQKQFREQPPNRQKLVNFFFSASDRYIRARRIVRGLTLSAEKTEKKDKMAARVQMLLWAPLHALGDKLVYRKVREAVGGELKLAVSGGGSLAMHLENFYEIAGIELLVGYGLTETAPVLTARRLWHNLRGSAGKPIPHTEIRIIDPDTRQTCEVGNKGQVLARGPQVMAGYFENPEATRKAIDLEGWFDTGDIGWLTRQQDLVLTGRAKDTIVLTNGENIEPQPIEDACARSPYIDQILLVGQDQKSLGALIVPNVEALKQWATEQNVTWDWPEGDGGTAALESQPVQDLFRRELNREVKNRPSYRPDDRIGAFRLIWEPFSVENGMLTQTLKIKRPVVMERYRDMINEMY
ncbi:MAG: AMP-dependent synthetase/ligase [Limnospira sp.]